MTDILAEEYEPRLEREAYPAEFDYAYAIYADEEPSCLHMYRTACRILYQYDCFELDPEYPYIYRPELVRSFDKFVRKFKNFIGQKIGEPIVLLPWQRLWIAMLLGWRLRSDPTMLRHKKAMMHIARRNGKTWVNMLLLFFELWRHREKLQIRSQSAVEEEASIMFDYINDILYHKDTPQQFRDTLHTKGAAYNKTITNLNTRSEYKVLAGKESDGRGINLIFIDEIAKIDPNKAGIIYKMQTSQADMKYCCFITMTTAQEGRLDSPYVEQLESMKESLKSLDKDEDTLAFIYEADPEDMQGENWQLYETYQKANPSHHVIGYRKYREAVETAKKNDRQKSVYCHLTLNSFSHAPTQWIPLHVWQKTCVESLERKGTAVVGFDLAQRGDLVALCYLYDDLSGYYDAEFVCFCPENTYNSILEDELRYIYDQGLEEGTLQISGLHDVQIADVVGNIQEVNSRNHVKLVAGDPRQALGLSAMLEERGFEPYLLRQSAIEQSPRVQQAEDLIHSGRIRTLPSKFMSWQIQNTGRITRTITGQTYSFIGKLGASKRKMDGSIALVNAVAATEPQFLPNLSPEVIVVSKEGNTGRMGDRRRPWQIDSPEPAEQVEESDAKNEKSDKKYRRIESPGGTSVFVFD